MYAMDSAVLSCMLKTFEKSFNVVDLKTWQIVSALRYGPNFDDAEFACKGITEFSILIRGISIMENGLDNDHQ